MRLTRGCAISVLFASPAGRRAGSFLLAALLALTPYLLVGPPDATAATGGSLSARPSRVLPGGTITLTGHVPPRRERPGELQRKRGSTWVTLARRHTSRTGAFRFTTSAFRTSTTYRVLAPRTRIGGRTYAAVHTPGRRVTTVQRSTPFVTRTSSNGRYFLDQHGRPILVKGDSPWAILVDATRTQMDNYVAIRKSQGFNVALVSLLGNRINGGPYDDGRTHDGVRPFVNGDPGRLNPRYWNRVAHFLGECRRAGITVMAYPIDGWVGTDTMHGLARNWSTTTARRYGAAVAARLHGYENVIWSVGGDYTIGASSADDARQYAVLRGLAAGGMNRISSIQFTLNDTSLDSPYWRGKVDYNFVYSYAVTYAVVQRAYQQRNPAGRALPALMGEAHYEAYGGVTNLYLRSMAAWALTSGSPGELYGSENVWDAAPRSAALRTTAVRQLAAIRRTFQRLDGWQRLVPDFSSSFVTGGRGTKGGTDGEYFPGDTGGDYVTGARTPDGRLAVLYLPDARGSVTIDQSKLVSGYTARWVDPTDGSSSGAAEGASYAHPGTNSAGAHDWLLVLEAG